MTIGSAEGKWQVGEMGNGQGSSSQRICLIKFISKSQGCCFSPCLALLLCCDINFYLIYFCAVAKAFLLTAPFPQIIIIMGISMVFGFRFCVRFSLPTNLCVSTNTHTHTQTNSLYRFTCIYICLAGPPKHRSHAPQPSSSSFAASTTKISVFSTLMCSGIGCDAVWREVGRGVVGVARVSVWTEGVCEL